MSRVVQTAITGIQEDQIPRGRYWRRPPIRCREIRCDRVRSSEVEIRESVVSFRGSGLNVIAQTYSGGQFGSNFPLVLNVPGIVFFTESRIRAQGKLPPLPVPSRKLANPYPVFVFAAVGSGPWVKSGPKSNEPRFLFLELPMKKMY